MLTKREFLGEEFYLLMKRDFDALREERKKLKGRPDAYELLKLEMNKKFEAFYKPWVT